MEMFDLRRKTETSQSLYNHNRLNFISQSLGPSPGRCVPGERSFTTSAQLNVSPGSGGAVCPLLWSQQNRFSGDLRSIVITPNTDRHTTPN